MKSKQSLVIWMLFGFLLFYVINSIISTCFYFYFHICLQLKILPYYIKMSSFILAFYVFDYTSLSFLNWINTNFNWSEFPKKPFKLVTIVLLLFVAVFLNPLKNRLDGLHLESLLSNPTFDDYLNPTNFVDVYSTMNFTISLCFWTIITFLLVYFYNFNKLKKHF